ncbi:MAG: hypothetical protein M3Y91_04605 [Actinomycetota bacterium]|nr:hypothetical protein [Actinomycetota bacterium]
MILALSQQNLNFWWIAIGMGVVVIGVVIVLLSLLVAYVKDIDDRVDDAWETALKVAENTTAVWQLTNTAQATTDLRDEVQRHADLLSKSA